MYHPQWDSFPECYQHFVRSIWAYHFRRTDLDGHRLRQGLPCCRTFPKALGLIWVRTELAHGPTHGTHQHTHTRLSRRWRRIGLNIHLQRPYKWQPRRRLASLCPSLGTGNMARPCDARFGDPASHRDGCELREKLAFRVEGESMAVTMLLITRDSPWPNP
jgi:hypothetical protein